MGPVGPPAIGSALAAAGGIRSGQVPDCRFQGWMPARPGSGRRRRTPGRWVPRGCWLRRIMTAVHSSAWVGRSAVIVDCAFYREGRRQQQGMLSLEEAAAGRDRMVSCGWGCSSRTSPNWPGSETPSACTSRARDTAHPGGGGCATVPFAAEGRGITGRGAVVILRTARYDDAREEIDFGEISVFLAPGVRDHRAAGGWPANWPAPGRRLEQRHGQCLPAQSGAVVSS
jgi:hypothetical protein